MVSEFSFLGLIKSVAEYSTNPKAHNRYKPKSKLIPLTEDLFAFEGTEYVRIGFIKENGIDKMEMKFFYKEEGEIVSKKRSG